MKCGISTSSFYPTTVKDAVINMAKKGVANIEIFINTLRELESDYLCELKRIAVGSNVNIISVHPFTCAFEPFMLFTEYQTRFEDALEWHKNYFNAMNILGAEYFVFHGDRFEGKLSNKAYFERFAKLRDLGKSFGITVAQENVLRCKSRSISFLKDMISYLDNDVSLVFDNKQAIRSGVDMFEFIEVFQKNIMHIHLSDFDRDDDCKPIGTGELDMDKMISKLKEISFEGCMMIELYCERLESIDNIYIAYDNLDKLLKKKNVLTL